MTHWCRSPSTVVRPGDPRGDAAQRDKERDEERPLYYPDSCSRHLPRLLLLHHRLPLPQGRLPRGGGPPSTARSELLNVLKHSMFYFFRSKCLEKVGNIHIYTCTPIR